MTDSTTLAGWLWKSNFIEDGESPIQLTIHLKVARLHASHYLKTGVRDYSQWFRCVENKVADALSRDDNHSDNGLTNIFRSHCPSQVPPHFDIVPLPNKIISRLTSLLLWLPQKKELAEVHTRMTLGRGPATPNIATALVSMATISLTEYPDSTNSQSWGLLPWLYAKGNFQDSLMLPWLKSQSQIPLLHCCKPSDQPRDAARQEECSDLDEKSVTTFVVETRGRKGMLEST